VSGIAASLRNVFEEVIARGHEPVNLVRRKFSGCRKIPGGPSGIPEPPPNGGGDQMHARKLVTVDDDEGTLGKVEPYEGDRLIRDQNLLKSADKVAPWRQRKLRVAALRVLTSVGLTTPLQDLAIAMRYCYIPKSVINRARIEFVVNPDI